MNDRDAIKSFCTANFRVIAENKTEQKTVADESVRVWNSLNNVENDCSFALMLFKQNEIVIVKDLAHFQGSIQEIQVLAVLSKFSSSEEIEFHNLPLSVGILELKSRSNKYLHFCENNVFSNLYNREMSSQEREYILPKSLAVLLSKGVPISEVKPNECLLEDIKNSLQDLQTKFDDFQSSVFDEKQLKTVASKGLKRILAFFKSATKQCKRLENELQSTEVEYAQKLSTEYKLNGFNPEFVLKVKSVSNILLSKPMLDFLQLSIIPSTNIFLGLLELNNDMLAYVQEGLMRHLSDMFVKELYFSEESDENKENTTEILDHFPLKERNLTEVLKLLKFYREFKAELRISSSLPEDKMKRNITFLSTKDSVSLIDRRVTDLILFNKKYLGYKKFLQKLISLSKKESLSTLKDKLQNSLIAYDTERRTKIANYDSEQYFTNFQEPELGSIFELKSEAELMKTCSSVIECIMFEKHNMEFASYFNVDFLHKSPFLRSFESIQSKVISYLDSRTSQIKKAMVSVPSIDPQGKLKGCSEFCLKIVFVYKLRKDLELLQENTLNFGKVFTSLKLETLITAQETMLSKLLPYQMIHQYQARFLRKNIYSLEDNVIKFQVKSSDCEDESCSSFVNYDEKLFQMRVDFVELMKLDFQKYNFKFKEQLKKSLLDIKTIECQYYNVKSMLAMSHKVETQVNELDELTLSCLTDELKTIEKLFCDSQTLLWKNSDNIKTFLENGRYLHTQLLQKVNVVEGLTREIDSLKAEIIETEDIDSLAAKVIELSKTISLESCKELQKYFELHLKEALLQNFTSNLLLLKEGLELQEFKISFVERDGSVRNEPNILEQISEYKSDATTLVESYLALFKENDVFKLSELKSLFKAEVKTKSLNILQDLKNKQHEVEAINVFMTPCFSQLSQVTFESSSDEYNAAFEAVTHLLSQVNKTKVSPRLSFSKNEISKFYKSRVAKYELDIMRRFLESEWSKFISEKDEISQELKTLQEHSAINEADTHVLFINNLNTLETKVKAFYQKIELLFTQNEVYKFSAFQERLHKCREDLNTFKLDVSERLTELRQTIDAIKEKILDTVSQNRSIMKDIAQNISKMSSYTSKSNTTSVLKKLETNQKTLDHLIVDIEKYKETSSLLSIGVDFIWFAENKNKLGETLELYIVFWNILAQYLNVLDVLEYTSVIEIDLDVAKTKLKQHLSELDELNTKAKFFQYADIIDKYEKLEKDLLFVSILQRPELKTHHFDKLNSDIAQYFDGSKERVESMIYNQLLQVFSDDRRSEVTKILNSVLRKACEEYEIESFLSETQKYWTTTHVSVEALTNNSKMSIITNLEGLIHKGEEQIGTLENIRNAKSAIIFSESIKNVEFEIDENLKLLDLIKVAQETVLEIVKFSSVTKKRFPSLHEDISTTFHDWESLITSVNNKKIEDLKTYSSSTSIKLEVLVTKIKHCYDATETKIKTLLNFQKKLFPKFCFLGEEALIHFLCGGLDYLKKNISNIFPNIMELLFSGSEIVGFITDYKLEILLLNPLSIEDVSCPGSVLKSFEELLTQTLKQMYLEARTSLLDLFNRSPESKMQAKFGGLCGQVILLAVQCICSTLSDSNLLTKFLELLKADVLAHLDSKVKDMIQIEIIRQENRARNAELDKENKGMTFMIHVDTSLKLTENRQNIDIKENSSSPNIVIKLCGRTWEYGWQYLSSCQPFIETQLTRKMFVNFALCEASNKFSNPFGQAGTGKTETIKFFAYNLGRPVAVFNCEENMCLDSVKHIFECLNCTKSWACFDEFNRLKTPVLSALASLLINLRKQDTVPNMFFTCNPEYSGRHMVPDSLSNLFLGIAATRPQKDVICSTLLRVQGLSETDDISQKLLNLLEIKELDLDSSLRTLKRIIFGIDIKLDDTASNLVAEAAVKVIQPSLGRYKSEKFLLALENVFGYQEPEKSLESLSLDTILDKMAISKCNYWATKVQQLYFTLQKTHGIICTGCVASGKRKALEVAKAMFETKECVQVKVINFSARAISLPCLSGKYNKVTQHWSDSYISQEIRRNENNAHLWFVIEGFIDSTFMEDLNSVLDESRVLTMANGERFELGQNIKFFFVTEDLTFLTAASLTRCSIVNFSNQELPSNVFASEKLLSLMNQNVSNILCSEDVTSYQVIPNKTSILKNIKKLLNSFDTAEASVDFVSRVEQWCAYWCLGNIATLETRQKILGSILNTLSSDFETFYPNTEHESFSLFSDSKLNPTEIQLVQTDEVKRYIKLFELNAKADIPLLLVGPPGSGKTLMLEQAFDTVDNNFRILNCSYNTKTTDILKLIRDNMTLKVRGNKNYYTSDKKFIIFCDEINLVRKESFGCVSINEFLCDLVERKGFYDRDTSGSGLIKFYGVENFFLVCACNPSNDAGRTVLSTRFLSNFQIIRVDQPSDDSLCYIYKTLLCKSLDNSIIQVESLSQKLVSVFRQHVSILKDDNLPFYVLSPRDIGRWYGSVEEKLNACCNDQINDRSIELLCYKEAMKIFTDRITTDVLKAKSLSILTSVFNIEAEVETPLSFDDKVHQILRAKEGHICLIGRKRTEKLLIAKRASKKASYRFVRISITKEYAFSQLQTVLKPILNDCVEMNKQIVVYVPVHHGVKTSVLEKLNSVLTRGEITSFFTLSERAKLYKNESEENVRLRIVKNLRFIFGVCFENNKVSEISPALYNRCFCIHVASDVGRYKNLLPAVNDLTLPTESKASLMTLFEKVEDLQQEDYFLEPQSLPEILHVFKVCYESLTNQSSLLANRLARGISLLEDVSKSLVKNETELNSKLVILREREAKAKEKMSDIVEEQKVLEKQKNEVNILRQELEQKAAEASKNETKAQKELDVVQPMLESAKTAVQEIDSRHLGELRSLRTPPISTKLVLELVLKLIKPEQILSGWNDVRKCLQSSRFVREVVDFDIYDADYKTVRSISAQLSEEALEDSRVKRASLACFTLFEWLKAQIKVREVVEKIKPLRDTIQALKLDQEDLNADLDEHRAKIDDLLKTIEKLVEEYDLLRQKVNSVKMEVLEIEGKVKVAKQLLIDFSTELTSWKSQKEEVLSQTKSNFNHSLSTALSYATSYKWSEEKITPLLKDAFSSSSEVLSTGFVDDVTRLRKKVFSKILHVDKVGNELDLKYCLNNESKVVIVFDQGESLQLNDEVYIVDSFLNDSSETSSRKSWKKTVLNTLRFGGTVVLKNFENYDPILNAVIEAAYLKDESVTFAGFGKVHISAKFKLILHSTQKYSSLKTILVKLPLKCLRLLSFEVESNSMKQSFLNSLIKTKDEELFNHLQKENEIDLKLTKEIEDYQEQVLSLLSGYSGNILEDEPFLKKLETLKQDSKALSERRQKHKLLLLESKTAMLVFDELGDTYNTLFDVLLQLSSKDPKYFFSLKFFNSIFDKILLKIVAEVENGEGVVSAKQILAKQFFNSISLCLQEHHIDYLKSTLEALLDFQIEVVDLEREKLTVVSNAVKGLPVLVLLGKSCRFDVPASYTPLEIEDDSDVQGFSDSEIKGKDICIQNIELLPNFIQKYWNMLTNSCEKLLLVTKFDSSLPNFVVRESHKIFLKDETKFSNIVSHALYQFRQYIHDENKNLALKIILIWAKFFSHGNGEREGKKMNTVSHLEALLSVSKLSTTTSRSILAHHFIVQFLESVGQCALNEADLKVVQKIWDLEVVKSEEITDDYLIQLEQEIV